MHNFPESGLQNVLLHKPITAYRVKKLARALEPGLTVFYLGNDAISCEIGQPVSLLRKS